MQMLELPLPEDQFVFYLATNEPIPANRLLPILSEIDKLSRRTFGRAAYVELLELSTGSVGARMKVWGGVLGAVAGAAGIGSFAIDVAQAIQDPNEKLNECVVKVAEGNGVVSVRLKGGTCDVTIDRAELPTPMSRLQIPRRVLRTVQGVTEPRPSKVPFEAPADRLGGLIAPDSDFRSLSGRATSKRKVRAAGKIYGVRGKDGFFLDTQGNRCEIDERSSFGLPPAYDPEIQNLLITGEVHGEGDDRRLLIQTCEMLDTI